ncbi:MAG: dUTP diphosphatase [Actinobacteria bacterium]|nr:dUTP diphosphatase [Actinomycetota bacterium]
MAQSWHTRDCEHLRELLRSSCGYYPECVRVALVVHSQQHSRTHPSRCAPPPSAALGVATQCCDFCRRQRASPVQQGHRDARSARAHIGPLDGDDRRTAHREGGCGDGAQSRDYPAPQSGRRGGVGDAEAHSETQCTEPADRPKPEPFAVVVCGHGATVPWHGCAPSPSCADYSAAQEALVSVDVLLAQLDEGLPLPSYAHPGDAGADLHARIDVTIAPGERVLVPTGVAIALPDSFAAFIHPRSGLALKHGIGMVNAPGTIDAGYRGEISVLLINNDPQVAHTVTRGDRIAQLVIQRVEVARFHLVETLPGSYRGDGGFGSTGLAAEKST